MILLGAAIGAARAVAGPWWSLHGLHIGSSLVLEKIRPRSADRQLRAGSGASMGANATAPKLQRNLAKLPLLDAWIRIGGDGGVTVLTGTLKDRDFSPVEIAALQRSAAVKSMR